MTTTASAPVIDLDALIAEVRALATENPGYTYPRRLGRACDYVRDGAPSCLIAQAAARVGVPVDVMQEWDELQDSGIGVILSDRYNLADQRSTWLEAAQVQQDDGTPWGEVPAAADQFIAQG